MEDKSAEDLFRLLDTDGSGFIDKAELGTAFSDLSTDELNVLFSLLDKNNDGKISFDDFKNSYLNCYSEVKKRRLSSQSSDVGLNANRDDDFVHNLDEGLKALSCQEQVCELYQYIHTADNPELLNQFESIILGVIKDIRTYQVENQRLEQSFKREKVQHENHLRQLEEEMEKEMKNMEEKVRAKQQELVTAEKAQLKQEVEDELATLKQNLTRMEQEGHGAKNRELEEQLLGMKAQLDDITIANRQLRSELNDAHTNMSLIRSDLTSVRQQYRDKCRELSLEKETVMDVIKEQDNLTRQLHLLQDANKRLHDTNDDLHEAIVGRISGQRSPVTGHSRASSTASTPIDRRGSVMSDYVQSGPPSIRSLDVSRTASIIEDEELDSYSVTGSIPPMPSPRLIRARLPREDTLEDDNPRDEIDSGHSTMRDINDVDSDLEQSYESEQRLSSSRHRRRQMSREDPDSHDEFDSDQEHSLHRDPRVYRHREKAKLPTGTKSRGGSRSRTREGGRESPNERRSVRKQGTIIKDEISCQVVTKEPERMFKIVLAGDAATGKSSFIMRLCKGKFVSNLSSTLGVDFQTKVIEVDGHTIALQLWDTAGQERFRSIAKSYFRRADGVFLLYDCSYERSFLNIRDWMESIEESGTKRIPIMLCANKTDLRESMEKQGRKVVHYDDGQRLAREFACLFIETSAKDGSNIIESVTELTRLMRANEDLEVKTAGLQLSEKAPEKSQCCGR